MIWKVIWLQNSLDDENVNLLLYYSELSDNWNHHMRLRDMKHIGFKHQRENKQNSDNTEILLKLALNTITIPPPPN
jgi:hypothetical protein